MSHFNNEWISKYLLKEPSILFDIGSYNGLQASKFKDSYPESRVIAIEADIRLFNKMKLNKKLINIEMHNLAICDYDGETNFFHNEGIKRGSGSIKKPSELIFKFDGMIFSEPKKIKCSRLDSLCQNLNIYDIDVLHMDVQSAEYEVIIGFGSIRPKMIFLEVSALNFYEKTTETSKVLSDMLYQKIDISDTTTGDELWILK